MQKLRKVAAWAIYSVALFLALGFATYDPFPSGLGRTSGGNVAGPAGEFTARILVEGVGVGAFVLCFFLLLTGWHVQKARPLSSPLTRVFGVLLVMFFFGTLLQVLLPERVLPGGQVPLGGLIGEVVGLRLAHVGGTLGGSIVLGTGLLLGLMLMGARKPADLLRHGRQAASAARSAQRRALARALEARSRATAEEARPARRKRIRKPVAVLEEEPEEDELEEDEEEWEEEPEEDEEQWEEEDDGEEDEDEGEEEWEEEEEEEAEEEEPEEEPAPVPSRQNPPRVRQAAVTRSDGIQVIRLTRDPRMRGKEKYELPPVTLLTETPKRASNESTGAIQRKAAALEEALRDFGIQAEVNEVERGPVITRFDLNLARGTKISRVTNLADDLAMALGVHRVRIAPVKGKSALGVEIPNRDREMVHLRELAVAVDMRRRKVAIPLFLGKDASGNPILEDLATTPHLLIAGRTGAGKSVFVNSLVLSILLTRYPEQVRLIMIDPKKVELEVYQDVPHLLTKVESNPKKAAKILEWAVAQMEERYEYLAAVGARHLSTFNNMARQERKEKLLRFYSPEEVEKIPTYLPYIVIIVDELADLMMVAGKDVEQAIARLAQKARAVGLHVVLATQRPSTDVITGLIKSNLPARIAFQTRTGIDSRTILDRYGAEKLLDKGDMLYLSATSDDPRRIQGPFVSDAEVEKVVSYLKKEASPQYTHHLEQVQPREAAGAGFMNQDELFDQAVDIVFTTGQASASFLQRRMKVGYARASRLIDLMGEAGIVSEHRGSKAREILMTPEDWAEMRQQLLAGSST